MESIDDSVEYRTVTAHTKDSIHIVAKENIEYMELANVLAHIKRNVISNEIIFYILRETKTMLHQR